MATVREKRPGYWEVRVFVGRDGSGKPLQASRVVQGTKKDAQRVAAQLILKPTPIAGRRTVAELIDAYVMHKTPTWAVQTSQDAEGRARLIKADPIGAMPISKVGVSDVDAWLLRMRRAGIGPGALRNRHSFLRACFQQAVRWEWITHNPVASASIGKQRLEPRQALTPDDGREVIAAAASFDPAAALALRLAAVAGLRRAEPAALRWTSLKDGLLTVDQQVTVDRRASNCYAIGPTKTANRRLIALDDSTVRMINELRIARQAISPFLFADGEQVPAPDRIGWWWNPARKIAAIDKRWRLHDLRHFSATHAIASGHDVRSVAARLGHADASMTMRVYAHAVQSRDELIAATMAGVLDEPAQPKRSARD
jgi:integrase